MSAGEFIIQAYQASYDIDNFHPIRVQPETLALALDVGGTSLSNIGGAASDINNPISARVSGGRRSLGLNASLIRLQWENNAPNGYEPAGIITLPLMNAAIRQVSRGSIGTYLGLNVIVIGTTPEKVN